MYLPLVLTLLSGQCTDSMKSQKMNEHKYTNDLVHETSPYLLQHAHNPVDWKPWGEEAFQQAKDENKLVLVSVGYSACHWCHVMEHETFEDSTAAAYMNENFVCVKVDREERPDVDQIYMNAVQLMTRSGGWPLNCFTLDDGRPIYGGTYFPKKKWMEVMESLVEMKKRDPQQLLDYAASLTDGVQKSELVVKIEDDAEFESATIEDMVQKWSKYWDTSEGGPRRAPKFPMPNNHEFLMSYGALNDREAVSEFVETTLDKMAQGGIYDQVGGGFARYSTDMKWKVPHFEKMLYDNAQLVSVYSQAFSSTGKDDYKRVVEQTLDFVARELTGPDGEFYSALDADSEGEEGKFYIWTKEELQGVLNEEQYAFVEDYYNVNSFGHWEKDHYILLRREDAEGFADRTGQNIEWVLAMLSEVNNLLFDARSSRVRPGLDDKSLTSWNALMIKGYVDAYKAFAESTYLDAAVKNAEFIWDKHQNDAVLLHNYKAGRSTINGYLEDYSFTIEAFVALYEVTFDEKWLKRSNDLMEYVIEHFYDENSGMFWFTSDIDPPLIARKMEVEDNVIPASNSSIAKGLYLLGTYYYNQEYIEKSKQMLKNVLPDMVYGQSFSNWAILHQWITTPFYEIAVTGDRALNKAAELNKRYIPNKLMMGGIDSSSLPLLEGKFLGETTIFICVNKSCRMPVSEVEEAIELMRD